MPRKAPVGARRQLVTGDCSKKEAAMRGNRLAHPAKWLAMMLSVVWLIGVFLVGDAQAGFFGNAKGGGNGSSKETASAPAKGSDEQKSGGSWNSDKPKPSAPAPSAAPRASVVRPYARDAAPAAPSAPRSYYAPEPRGQSRPAPAYVPPARDPVVAAPRQQGSFLGGSANRPDSVAPAPSPRDSQGDAGYYYYAPRNGAFGNAKSKPKMDTPAPAAPRANDADPGLYSSPRGGAFGNAKNKPKVNSPASAAPRADDPGLYSSPRGGAFGNAKNKPRVNSPASAAPRADDPGLYSSPRGGAFGNAKNKPRVNGPAPAARRDGNPATGFSSRPDGGVLGNSKNGPRNSVAGPTSLRGSGAGFFARPTTDTFRPDRDIYSSVVRTAPRHGWTSRGYFELLHEQLAADRLADLHRFYWYYPYDYCYYRWRHFHILPLFVRVDDFYFGTGYIWGGYQYYYAAPPVVVVVEPRDWVDGETYIPYSSWPSSDLMQAKDDFEQAWRHNRIDLIDRHLDADHEIASYLRDEHTHDLTADEFRQLTLDAFSSIRTRNFDITSVRYVSNSDWARLYGKHIFYDPNDRCITVYLSYLLRRVEDDYGRWRWVIWEVRQSPRPD